MENESKSAIVPTLSKLQPCYLLLIFEFLIHFPKNHCFNEHGEKDHNSYDSEQFFSDAQLISKRFLIFTREHFSPNYAAINLFILDDCLDGERVLNEQLTVVKSEINAKRKRNDIEINYTMNEEGIQYQKVSRNNEEEKESSQIVKFAMYM
jgi:hypothetical protein